LSSCRSDRAMQIAHGVRPLCIEEREKRGNCVICVRDGIVF
jgi:hypothetical protein